MKTATTTHIFQSKSITLSAKYPHYWYLCYYTLLFLPCLNINWKCLILPLPHGLHRLTLDYKSFQVKGHVFNILIFAITTSLLYEWLHKHIFEY